MEGRDESVWQPEAELISITPYPEKVIEQAYRNCWQSEPADRGKNARRRFLRKCIGRGHTTCLEFAFATFRIVGSRAFTHQQVRHRVASYAQESQRYVEQNDPSRVVVPPAIHADPEALEIFLVQMRSAWEAYDALLKKGIRKEDARYVLPNACKSCIFVGMNFRAWRHFLKLRCDKAAQWEIRGVALEILKVLYHKAPAVFGDLYERFVLGKDVELWTQGD